MNISKFETFLKVVELGSLTKAAEQLGYTQSAVSHIISGLEEDFGFSLLTRSRSGVKLTSDGERILPAIRTILNSREQLGQITASIRGLHSGTVRIGAFTSVAVHWLPGMIKTFQQDYPNIDFKLLNGDYFDIEQWLGDCSVDAGFVNLPCNPECECIPLREDRVLAVLPKGHCLCGRPFFPLAELEKEPFISLLENSDHDARRALEHTGVIPHVKFYTKDDYAIIAMVEQGLGISIMPELVLEGHMENIEVMELENRPRRTIGLAIPPGSQTSPATRKFVDYAIHWVEKNAK